MKIGIMTFWWSEDNYGQILQCYALQKYLRDAGHDAYLIRYDKRNDFIKTPLFRKMIMALNPVKLYRFLVYKKKEIADIHEKKENPRNFEIFREKYIKQSDNIYYSYNELVENPPIADIYITGSDQVWNTFSMPYNRSINVIRAYLLDFGDSLIKRIAYAASFGKDVLDNAFIAAFSPLLKKFDYISVREKTGLDICKKCGLNDADWVPDPTMLLDVDIYRSLYKDENIKKPNKAYCLLYILGNESNFPIQNVYSWANKTGIEIIYITGNLQHDKYKKTYSTIPEWIYLIEHAEYVITNSFHCSVLSFFFKKQFGIIPLDGKDIGMNSRFDSLFELFQLEKRFIDSDFSILNKEIDWQLVLSMFKKIKSDSKLLDALFKK